MATSAEKTKADVLAAIPVDGTAVGNGRLRDTLGLSLQAYLQAIEVLVTDGAVERWKGRGGTVRRKNLPIPTVLTPRTEAEDEKLERETSTRLRVLEQKLYPSFLEGLKLWASAQGWTEHTVNQIANQGSKRTGGIWTRPDFAVIGSRKFEYTPGIVRDVETFEVKPASCGIDAVFETAAHSRFATRSFLAIHKTPNEPDEMLLERIEDECFRFGIGMILFSDAKNYDAWEYRVDPERKEPDPSNLEEFIRLQIPTLDQERVRKWLR